MGWFLGGLLAFGWFVVAPLLGVLGFAKASRVERELHKLRRQQNMPDLKPEPRPEARPDPSPEMSAAPPVAPEASSERPISAPSTPIYANNDTVSAPPSHAPRRSAGDWEQLIAANWMIWIGGLTVAIGGLLLVRFVLEAGLLNDAARVTLGASFGVALIVAGFRANASALVQKGTGATEHLPSILVAAGVTVLNGAVFAAGALYGLVPPLLALGSYVLVAALAVALSVRFGRWVAALGLVGAYFGPLFTGASGGSVALLMAYAAGITGGALALIRLREWPQLIVIALVGASFWGLAGVSDVGAPMYVLPVYALAIAGMGTFFGARAAIKPLAVQLSKPEEMLRAFLKGDMSFLAAYLFAILGGGLILLDILDAVEAVTLGALLVFAGAGLVLAWRRPGFALLAPLGGLVTLASLFLWPERGSLGGAELTQTVLGVVAGYALIGGWLALNGLKMQRTSAELAGAAALVPPAALFVPVSGLFADVSGFWWGYIALIVATGFVGVLEGLKRKHPAFEGIEKTAAAFALGAFLCAVLTPFAFLSGLWLGTALAVLALGICLVYLRFPLGILRFCALLAITSAIGLLMRPWLLDTAQISTVPVFNELLFGYGIAIVALGAAAWLIKGTKRLYEAYLGGALILGFALLGLEIRHFAQGGDLYSAGLSLGEMSGYAITYLGMAVSFAWRLSVRGWLFKLAEHIGAVIGVGAVVIGLCLLPSEPALGVPVLNLLLVMFAMPALMMAAYAGVLRRKARMGEARFWGWLAIGLGFIAITLETRRMLVGPDVLSGAVEGGVWAYSVAWLAYAVFLLFWGTLRRRASARFASLGVLLLAVGKVFVFDLALLEGVVRAVSFIGLGGCLIAIALFYQRYVFGREKGEAAVE